MGREHGATAVEVKSSELQGFMAKHPELLTNSKPDVVVVNFPTKESLATVVSATEKSIAPADSRVSILSTTSEMKDDVSSSLMPFYSSSNLWPRPATIQQAQAG